MLPGAQGLVVALALAASTPDPLWLTLDVENPEVTGGHRLLNLSDVVGAERRADIPKLPRARALLVFTVTPGACGRTGLCAMIAERTEAARARGALVVAVVLATEEQAGAARAEVRAARHPIVVTFDVHQLVRRAFEFVQPGEFFVMDGKGVNTSRFSSSKAGDPAQVARTLEQVRTALLTALGPDEENRR